MSGKLMSEKYPGAAGEYDPAMSFDEIGARLGISKQAAYFLFVSALKKLRAQKNAMRRIAVLADELDRARFAKTL